MHPLGSREVGKQTYSSLGFTLGWVGGSYQSQMLEPTWEEKAKKTEQCHSVPAKKESLFPDRI